MNKTFAIAALAGAAQAGLLRRSFAAGAQVTKAGLAMDVTQEALHGAADSTYDAVTDANASFADAMTLQNLGGFRSAMTGAKESYDDAMDGAKESFADAMTLQNLGLISGTIDAAVDVTTDATAAAINTTIDIADATIAAATTISTTAVKDAFLGVAGTLIVATNAMETDFALASGVYGKGHIEAQAALQASIDLANNIYLAQVYHLGQAFELATTAANMAYRKAIYETTWAIRETHDIAASVFGTATSITLSIL